MKPCPECGVEAVRLEVCSHCHWELGECREDAILEAAEELAEVVRLFLAEFEDMMRGSDNETRARSALQQLDVAKTWS